MATANEQPKKDEETGFVEISKEAKAKIVSSLQKRGVKKSCPRCDHPSFTLLGAYLKVGLSNRISGPTVLGGASIPAVVTVCDNCGYLAWHALGGLELLEELQREEGKK